MERPRTAVVDFDGTIAAYSGWRGPGVYGDPIPGAQETLCELAARGWEIIVHTARAWEERPLIEEYLRRHGIPYTQVVCGKPLGAVYVDDRSTGRGGDWAAVRRDLGLHPPDPFIHPTAIVEAGAEVGPGTRIWHHAHVRSGARIGPGCTIGKGVYVDAGVIIGAGCKVQNGANLYRGVVLEDEVFVGPAVTFTNDRYPRAQGVWQPTPTRVGKGASIGAAATVVCGNDIGAYAVVAAGAVVTHPVPPHALVAGVPARRMGWACACGRPARRQDNGTWRCPGCGALVPAGDG